MEEGGSKGVRGAKGVSGAKGRGKGGCGEVSWG